MRLFPEMHSGMGGEAAVTGCTKGNSKQV